MRKGKDTGRTMDPDMPVLRPSIPPTPMGPSWRGRRSRGGGWGGLMPTMDEFFGTSTQVCGGFWPFSTDMALPVEGVPIGRSMTTGAGVCCDPISWFRAGIIEQPSMFVVGLLPPFVDPLAQLPVVYGPLFHVRSLPFRRPDDSQAMVAPKRRVGGTRCLQGPIIGLIDERTASCSTSSEG